MQIVVDGLLTNYQTIGEKNKPAFLILHGWKRSIAEWIPIAKEISKKYYVILVDLPGFGNTALSQRPFSIYDYADFVEHFLGKLNIQKVTLLGHSFGGRIGIILGSKPNMLEKLILVDAAGVEKRTLVAKAKILFFKLVKTFLPKALSERLRHSLGSPDYRTAGALRATFLRVINEDLSYLLPKIAVPTLLIWGSKDTEVTEWKIKRMKQTIPQVKLRVVWEAGHSPYMERPGEFMEILKEFI